MSIHRHGMSGRGMSGRGAERLLRAAASGAPAGPEPLARLLAAAAAPAPESVPAGEEAALAAFRMARRAPAPTTDRGAGSGLAMLLTAKAAAAVLTAATIGGVALAAGTGNLPGRHRHAGHHPPTHTQRESRPAGTPSATAGRTERPTPSPPTSLTGLCLAYERNRRGDERGRALEDPAFTPLITAAGGENQVANYCGTLLRTTRDKRPEPTPKASTHQPNKTNKTNSTDQINQTRKPTAKPDPRYTRPTGRSARPRS